MQHFDTSKLKSAMIDAAILHAERMMKDDNEPVEVSNLYREKWENTVNDFKNTKLKRKHSKYISVLLIAALIALLTSCALIYREIIAGFLVTAYDKYNKVEQQNNENVCPKVIEQIKIPTWVPDGYALVSEQKIHSIQNMCGKIPINSKLYFFK